LAKKLKYKNKNMPKIKNIIIFGGIAIVLILVYIFFIKPTGDQQNLVSSTSSPIGVSTTNTLDQNSAISRDFLSVLLSVKSIKLNDVIFSNGAFINLHDSSILLVPPGNEGRPNPFAPIGSDNIPTTIAPPTTIIDSSTTGTQTTTPTTTLPPIKTPTTPKTTP
jgi:hypothetical protein